MLSRKRIVALLLALAMLTTLFAGCGSTTEESAAPAASAVEASAQDESPAAEDAPAEAETPVSTVEEPISAEEPAEEIELGTIEYPLDAEGETLSFWLPWMPALSM